MKISHSTVLDEWCAHFQKYARAPHTAIYSHLKVIWQSWVERLHSFTLPFSYPAARMEPSKLTASTETSHFSPRRTATCQRDSAMLPVFRDLLQMTHFTSISCPFSHFDLKPILIFWSHSPSLISVSFLSHSHSLALVSFPFSHSGLIIILSDNCSCMDTLYLLLIFRFRTRLLQLIRQELHAVYIGNVCASALVH